MEKSQILLMLLVVAMAAFTHYLYNSMREDPNTDAAIGKLTNGKHKIMVIFMFISSPLLFCAFLVMVIKSTTKAFKNNIIKNDSKGKKDKKENKIDFRSNRDSE